MIKVLKLKDKTGDKITSCTSWIRLHISPLIDPITHTQSTSANIGVNVFG